MGTVYSVQKTLWDQSTPRQNIKTRDQVGRVRIAFAEYEAAALDADEVIEMFNLPNGARILDGFLHNDALGASTTLSVGHAAYVDSDGDAVALDVDEFLAATDTSSAARTDVAATLALQANSVVDANEDGIPITAVLAGAAATGTIQLMMRYVVD